jgi:hypothetical protein
MMSYKEALDFAIFALNTLMHPDASGALDVQEMEDRSEEIIETLADMRSTVTGLP